MAGHPKTQDITQDSNKVSDTKEVKEDKPEALIWWFGI